MRGYLDIESVAVEGEDGSGRSVVVNRLQVRSISPLACIPTWEDMSSDGKSSRIPRLLQMGDAKHVNELLSKVPRQMAPFYGRKVRKLEVLRCWQNAMQIAERGRPFGRVKWGEIGGVEFEVGRWKMEMKVAMPMVVRDGHGQGKDGNGQSGPSQVFRGVASFIPLTVCYHYQITSNHPRSNLNVTIKYCASKYDLVIIKSEINTE